MITKINNKIKRNRIFQLYRDYILKLLNFLNEDPVIYAAIDNRQTPVSKVRETESIQKRVSKGEYHSL